jgi:hypothetical protein
MMLSHIHEHLARPGCLFLGPPIYHLDVSFSNLWQWHEKPTLASVNKNQVLVFNVHNAFNIRLKIARMFVKDVSKELVENLVHVTQL